jgi:uncharacterized protein
MAANVTEKRSGKQVARVQGYAAGRGHPDRPSYPPERQGCLSSVRSPGIVHHMRFAQDNLTGNIIRGYAPGQVTINDEVMVTSVIVTPDRIICDWLPHAYRDLEPRHLARLEELQPEIIVLGTGLRLRFPDAAFTAGFLSQGIGVEIMDTTAACRTYNILLSEGRRVVAALLMA